MFHYTIIIIILTISILSISVECMYKPLINGLDLFCFLNVTSVGIMSAVNRDGEVTADDAENSIE